jgi:hypothetical protein
MRPEVEVKNVSIPQGEETDILCRTSGRQEKRRRFATSLPSAWREALERLAKTIAGRPPEGSLKVERRWGAFRPAIPQVNDLYDGGFARHRRGGSPALGHQRRSPRAGDSRRPQSQSRPIIGNASPVFGEANQQASANMLGGTDFREPAPNRRQEWQARFTFELGFRIAPIALKTRSAR